MAELHEWIEQLDEVSGQAQEPRRPLPPPANGAKSYVHGEPEDSSYGASPSEMLKRVGVDEFKKKYGIKVQKEGDDKWSITYKDGHKDVGNFLAIIKKCIEIASRP